MEKNPSIVEYFSEHESYRCGYCGSKDTNYSHGMWAHQMTVRDYQDLIDRGWRRSGKYCYKPTMNRTCCPQYTIRCKVLDFKLNKSHKKALKKVNRFLITGARDEGASDRSVGEEGGEASSSDANSKGMENVLAEKAMPSDIIIPKKKTKKKKDLETEHEKQSLTVSSLTEQGSSVDGEKDVTERGTSAESTPHKHIPRPGSGPDPSKPLCRKAKDIRAERRLLKKGNSGDQATRQAKQKQNVEKTLEDFLNEPSKAENPAHKLELRLIRSSPPSDSFTSSFSASHAVYHKYQRTIHKDPPGKPNMQQYKRFLCDSPLEEQEDGGSPVGYGSFHQHYLLDGKIIAVGVLDILPACVSSVYLYYDPDYSFLGLGVYSALRELALVRELNQSAPELEYYYMGFYIHSCPKMRYKGQYVPSFISCPESYSWVPIEKCRPKLDASAYSRLEEEGVEDKEKNIEVNQVLCLHKGTMLPYAFYKMMKSKGSDEGEVREYAEFVGKTCAERMLLVRK